MRIRSFTAPAVLVTGALLLAACGGDSSPLEGKTGSEVAELAADALEKSGAVHVTGTTMEDGEEAQIDLQLQGDDAVGSISVGGTEIQLISVGGDVYVEASPDFLAPFGMSAEDAAQYEGKWVALPADSAAGFAGFSLSSIADELRSPDGEITDDTRGDEVDGTSVVIVELEDGSMLTVADDDPAYPLELTGADDSEGSVTFSGFGEEKDISAPRDVVDLEELAGS